MKYLRKSTGNTTRPTWQDNKPAWKPDDHAGRYVDVVQVDRWLAASFATPPAPDRGAVLQRVQEITESLQGAIDEGTGAILDRLIDSWTAEWIAAADAEYTDHCATITVHRAQAEQWLEESIRMAKLEREELERIQSAYLARHDRLNGERPGPGHQSTEKTDASGDLS